jgi:hypothetical protein
MNKVHIRTKCHRMCMHIDKCRKQACLNRFEAFVYKYVYSYSSIECVDICIYSILQLYYI